MSTSSTRVFAGIGIHMMVKRQTVETEFMLLNLLLLLVQAVLIERFTLGY